MKVILKIRYATLIKSLIGLFSVGVVIASASFLYFYYDNIKKIDKAFQEHPWENFPTVRSAPTALFPGQVLTSDQVLTLAHQRGYIRSTFLDQPPAYQVCPDGSSLLLANEQDWAPRGEHTPRWARVSFAGGRIAAIHSPRDGRALSRFYIRPAILSSQQGGSRRMRATFSDLPPNLIYAVLAAEDQHFFDHPGVDASGILRSLWKNLRRDRIVEGGSTISQQLAKNIFLSTERTFARKLREAFIALILESRLTKTQLFELYANQVYLGQTATFSIYGFAQAADVYCNKSIRNLTLADCALLAGMIRSPNQEHPFRHPEEALRRRDQVLSAMVGDGFILPEEQAAAREEPIPKPDAEFFKDLKAPYFLDYLTATLPDPLRRGPGAGGKPIDSTLNLELQAAAEKGLAEGIARIRERVAAQFPEEPLDRIQGAMVVLAPRSGEILAMLGGLDYRQSPFNRAVFGRRQAGSILKPLLYSALIDAGRREPALDLTSASMIHDGPVTIRFGRKMYVPHNYRNSYLGDVTMKTALAHSLNAATVLFAQRVGFANLSRHVNSFGFTSRAVPYPAIALGALDVTPLEMAAAYTAFYLAGVPCRARCQNPDPTWSRPHVSPPAIFSAGAAFITLDMMREAVESGTAQNLRRLQIDLPLAAKTGTAKDGWFMGLAGNLVVCCWIGYDQRREFPLSGGESALLVFASFLKHAEAIYPVTAFPFDPPPGLTSAAICSRSGRLATSHCPRTELDYFFPGTAPLSTCHLHP